MLALAWHDSQGRETMKCSHESCGTRNKEWLCWRGPAEIYLTRPAQRVTASPSIYETTSMTYYNLDYLPTYLMCFICSNHAVSSLKTLKRHCTVIIKILSRFNVSDYRRGWIDN
jgi:hypothetical protein